MKKHVVKRRRRGNSGNGKINKKERGRDGEERRRRVSGRMEGGGAGGEGSALRVKRKGCSFEQVRVGGVGWLIGILCHFLPLLVGVVGVVGGVVSQWVLLFCSRWSPRKPSLFSFFFLFERWASFLLLLSSRIIRDYSFSFLQLMIRFSFLFPLLGLIFNLIF